MPTCAFTGHRPQHYSFKYDETSWLCHALKNELGIAARKLYDQKRVRCFLIGGAIGADIWAGEEIIKMMREYKGISLRCVIPYRGHDTEWPKASRIRLQRITEQSEVVYLQESFSPDAYASRNRYLVDQTDFMIALYDYDKAAASGTGQTVRYAQCRGRPMVLIHPTNATVTYWYPKGAMPLNKY